MYFFNWKCQTMRTTVSSLVLVNILTFWFCLLLCMCVPLYFQVDYKWMSVRFSLFWFTVISIYYTESTYKIMNGINYDYIRFVAIARWFHSHRQCKCCFRSFIFSENSLKMKRRLVVCFNSMPNSSWNCVWWNASLATFNATHHCIFVFCRKAERQNHILSSSFILCRTNKRLFGTSENEKNTQVVVALRVHMYIYDIQWRQDHSKWYRYAYDIV